MNLQKLLVPFLIWRLKHVSDTNFTLIMAGFVGLLAGLASVTLKTTVHLIEHLLQNNIEVTGFDYLWVFYPLIGILLTVIISKFIIKESTGHGISKVLYAISKRSSVIRKTRMYSNMLTSAITVGFGGSVGLEAPIVVTGSAIGSNLARLVHLDYKKRTLLIGCGSAGAISAIFNSPIAGVIFAVEVMLTDVTINKFIPILIASVCGQLVSLVLLGDDILFAFRLTDGFSASETPYYLLLGILCGGASLYFTKILTKVDEGVSKIKSVLVRALLGGMSLGLIILIFPSLYGEGYAMVIKLLNDAPSALFKHHILNDLFSSGHFLFLPLALMGVILLKPIATGLTIGSGGSGGIFAPSLYMGGLVGFFVGLVIQLIYPSAPINLSHFTLVGMCGVMSGVLHAPLTAIFLIAEITSGYMLFVPLMLVSAISYSTVTYFDKHSIYTRNLIRRGDIVVSDRDKMVLNKINLEKIIEKDLLTINPDATLDQLINLVKKSTRNIFPVVTETGELKGIITLDHIREIMFDESKRTSVLVSTLMTEVPAHVSSHDSMQIVMNKFEISQAWNLPVIDEGKYIGFLSKSRIFNTYRTHLIRQTKE
jgi:chloride channel protein, CIC family|tara:strand:- start:2339 stop:4123 length:1785 start_codon:yes stop_codon:yes gene_type:complete